MPEPEDRRALLEPVAQAVRADLEAYRTVPPDGRPAVVLRRFLEGYCAGSPYRVTSGRVIGERTDAAVPHDCLVMAAGAMPALPTAAGSQIVPADAVFGVVDACEVLDADSLAAAAHRVAEVKRVHRRPLFRGEELANPYLGALVAMGGIAGRELLEALAAENDPRPFEEQIDVVCVLDRGLVGHADVEGGAAPSIELPLQASPRWRLTWVELGPRALLAFVLTLWQTLAARELRAPRMHALLTDLAGGSSHFLPVAHGIDRGE